MTIVEFLTLDQSQRYDADLGIGLAETTLRLLALPYADHPDYDPAWRP